MNIFKFILILFFISLGFNNYSFGQKAKLIGDIQLMGFGLENQTYTLGNTTYTESITGMSGIAVGVNIPMFFKFSTSISVGILIKAGMNSNTTYTSSGSTSSSSSNLFVIPKASLGLDRDIIFSEKKFIRGIQLGGGMEYYGQSNFSMSKNGDDLDINYKPSNGYYLRMKLVFKPFGKIQLMPNFSYRKFNLNAENRSRNGVSTLDESLRELKVRNFEIGLMLLYDAF